jgi:hypothetical protein
MSQTRGTAERPRLERERVGPPAVTPWRRERCCQSAKTHNRHRWAHRSSGPRGRRTFSGHAVTYLRSEDDIADQSFESQSDLNIRELLDAPLREKVDSSLVRSRATCVTLREAGEGEDLEKHQPELQRIVASSQISDQPPIPTYVKPIGPLSPVSSSHSVIPTMKKRRPHTQSREDQTGITNALGMLPSLSAHPNGTPDDQYTQSREAFPSSQAMRPDIDRESG